MRIGVKCIAPQEFHLTMCFINAHKHIKSLQRKKRGKTCSKVQIAILLTRNSGVKYGAEFREREETYKEWNGIISPVVSYL